MSLIDAIRNMGWNPPSCLGGLEEQEFDPHTGEGVFFLYETDACNFEVLHKGSWYRIDAGHLSPDLYEGTGVPNSVLARARGAVWPLYDSDGWDDSIDPTPRYLAALQRVFDDVHFVGMTIVPGAIY